MDRVFIYWDNSNIYISAKEIAAEREGEGARTRVRIHFRNLLRLAHADRPIQRAVAAGSIPPELRHVWNRMENEGVKVRLFEQGAQHGREQGVDYALQMSMLRDMIDHTGDPGIVMLLTGDGKGFADGVGFQADLERIHRRKWRIEVLSWTGSCNRRMKEWAEQNGKFIALDDFYDSITFLELPQPGHPVADPRDAVQVDLSRRPM